ncbi:MAG: DUF1501 domain-containing protein [Planctomycetales bacterium]|nr:DUF1501 domain-containing protein [Planctomycetales bacterium]
MNRQLFDTTMFQPSRREMLVQGGAGFGALALAYLMGRDPVFASRGDAEDTPHHRPTAKSVIFCFMEGGPSHIDLFDPKPRLSDLAGKPLPESFGPIITPMGEYDAPIMPSPRKWKQHGQCGTWVSEWLPNIAECVDDIAVIRSCWADGLNHSNGVCQMNTGSILGGRPSLGAWVTYGLGTENENLPAFVVMEDNPGKVINGPRNWSGGFMPAAYQGTAFVGGPEPVRYLTPAAEVTDARQRGKLAFLKQLNKSHAELRDQSELDARIKSYELAYRMQSEAPQAVDLSQESAATQQMYGMDEKETEVFGRNCLLARRLVERGVRFVQLYHGSGSKWDAHSGIEKNHSTLCRASDKPVAGLLKDLKQRGLLDQTLVVWGGEFGRTPMSEKGDGRDHNPYGFTMWMAGGGVKRGVTVGRTDDLGYFPVEDPVHVHDFHATLLHLLGLDHERLTFKFQGRQFRLTDIAGNVVQKLIG